MNRSKKEIIDCYHEVTESDHRDRRSHCPSTNDLISSFYSLKVFPGLDHRPEGSANDLAQFLFIFWAVTLVYARDSSA
jgi:hypothetical protein